MKAVNKLTRRPELSNQLARHQTRPSSSGEYGYSRYNRCDETNNGGNEDIDRESQKQDLGDPDENSEQKHLKDSNKDDKEEQEERHASSCNIFMQ